MVRTRVFKSGDGQAVHLPAEIAYDDPNIELEITRTDDIITICPARYPARQNLKELVETLRRMPKPAEIERLERTEPRKTRWD